MQNSERSSGCQEPKNIFEKIRECICYRKSAKCYHSKSVSKSTRGNTYST
jgi:hypothetical protein